MDNHTTLSRVCSQCQREFPLTLDYFHANKSNSYGLNTRCKECIKAHVKRWQSENPERVRATKRKSHKRHRESIKEKRKQQWQDNPEFRAGVIRRSEKWVAANRDKVNSKKRRLNQQPNYRLQNRLAQQRRRRLTALTKQQVIEIWEELQGRCAYCGISIFLNVKRDVTIEHIVPIVRGGTGDLINITLACLSCNTSKKDRLYDEWKAVRGW